MFQARKSNQRTWEGRGGGWMDGTANYVSHGTVVWQPFVACTMLRISFFCIFSRYLRGCALHSKLLSGGTIGETFKQAGGSGLLIQGAITNAGCLHGLHGQHTSFISFPSKGTFCKYRTGRKRGPFLEERRNAPVPFVMWIDTADRFAGHVRGA